MTTNTTSSDFMSTITQNLQLIAGVNPVFDEAFLEGFILSAGGIFVGILLCCFWGCCCATTRKCACYCTWLFSFAVFAACGGVIGYMYSEMISTVSASDQAILNGVQGNLDIVETNQISKVFVVMVNVASLGLALGCIIGYACCVAPLPWMIKQEPHDEERVPLVQDDWQGWDGGWGGWEGWGAEQWEWEGWDQGYWNQPPPPAAPIVLEVDEESDGEEEQEEEEYQEPQHRHVGGQDRYHGNARNTERQRAQ